MAFKDISNHAVDVSFSIPHVSILKKRHDAVKKCDVSLKDNDNRFRMKVSKKVGCIPIYWRHILNPNVSLPICNESIQLNQIYNLIRFSKNFLLTYDPPCVELMTPISTNRRMSQDFGTKLVITVLYATETFEEITNVRDFDIESLWSSAGGFIGLFLGYSLVQVTEILNVNWLFILKELNLRLRITSFVILVMAFVSGHGKIILFKIKIDLCNQYYLKLLYLSACLTKL